MISSVIISWWRHQMETFSALLDICAGNGEFPAQRPVTRSFDIIFDLRLSKRSSKQSLGWWVETLSCALWRQLIVHQCISNCKYNSHGNWMRMFIAYLYAAVMFQMLLATVSAFIIPAQTWLGYCIVCTEKRGWGLFVWSGLLSLNWCDWCMAWYIAYHGEEMRKYFVVLNILMCQTVSCESNGSIRGIPRHCSFFTTQQ